jgi:redox-sensing transcriptional repressor
MDSRTTASVDGSDFGEQISERTISRMRWYLYALEDCTRRGISTVASHEIAEKVGVKSGLVRKDLCHFGGFGRPSVGYNVTYLQKKIREILRLNEEKKVAWVGSRRLMDDLSVIERFADRNCVVTAIFDNDPAMAGTKVRDIEVLGMDHVDKVVRDMRIETAVVATSEEDAQQAVDKLISGGAKAILNLSPTVVSVPPGVAVRNIDLAGELIMLAYYCGDGQNDG